MTRPDPTRQMMLYSMARIILPSESCVYHVSILTDSLGRSKLSSPSHLNYSNCHFHCWVLSPLHSPHFHLQTYNSNNVFSPLSKDMFCLLLLLLRSNTVKTLHSHSFTCRRMSTPDSLQAHTWFSQKTEAHNPLLSPPPPPAL